ncbi:hypothetical protein GCM10010222_28540 [Streptomyces tanashiensis]|nr:hypothetical protein GCM10010222_28540 [Streptomyces tanashiensis]GGY12969.1 hypothetical protein GCM10010299_16880 [Streptomyces tanashiensis]
MLGGVAADEIRQVAVRGDLVQGRKAELAQDCCSSSGAGATALCDAPVKSMIGQVLSGGEHDWTARTLPTSTWFPIGGPGQMFRASHMRDGALRTVIHGFHDSQVTAGDTP